MGNLDLHTALASCNYYPVQINLCRRVIWFAGIEREMYRRAGFLVPKQAHMGEERYGFNLDDVLLHDLSLPIGGAPSHYIFISAFCCSTLLARLLDRVPDCLVLKEPSVLGQLAMLRYRPVATTSPSPQPAGETPALQPGSPARTPASERSGHGAEWEENWQTWAALSMRLLTRTFDSGQTVIVKAADVCNTMGDIILANDPRSKVVLLSVGLRTFVLSVLKLENRRVWTRKRAAFWHKTLTLFPALNEVNVPELDDAQKAAYVWLVTDALRKVAAAQTAERIETTLDGTIFGDGVFVGPDTSKLYERFQAEQQAEVDEANWLIKALTGGMELQEVRDKLSEQVYAGVNCIGINPPSLYTAALGRQASRFLDLLDYHGQAVAQKTAALQASAAPLCIMP